MLNKSLNIKDAHEDVNLNTSLAKVVIAQATLKSQDLARWCKAIRSLTEAHSKSKDYITIVTLIILFIL